jgi:6-phosphogluconolactonase (cycloisomerase 2 family)
VAPINPATGAVGTLSPATVQGNTVFSYPTIALAPSKKFLYALFDSFTVVEGYSISGPNLNLSSLPNTPFFLSSIDSLNSLVLHPSGQFLYLIGSPFSTIEVQAVDTHTGNLTFASSIAESADLRAGAIDPTGQFLYVTDLTGGRIFAYQINSSTGALTTVAGSPFSVPLGTLSGSSGPEPNVPVIDKTGSFLYVSLMAAGVAAFEINPSTGALTNVAGSPFLTSSVPTGIATDPAGNFLYICNSPDGFVEGFTINISSGGLAPVPGSPFGTAAIASYLAIDPSGKFVYVGNFVNNSVYGFALDDVSGSLTPISGSPFPSVSSPNSLFVVQFP